MIVTNEDIDKDILENLMVRQDAVKPDVVKDMMLYMREIYERKIETLSKDNAIMESALNAVGTVENDRREKSARNYYGEDLAIENEIEYMDGYDENEEETTTDRDRFEDMISELINSFSEALGTTEVQEPEDKEYAICAGITCEGKESCLNYIENIDGTLQNIVNNASAEIDYVACIKSGHQHFKAK